MPRIRPKTRWALLPVALALALQGCALDVAGPSARHRGQLRAARELWAAQKLAGYRYTVRQNCFCGGPEVLGPVRVEVRGGLTVSVTHLQDGVAILPGAFDGLDTVEELFSTVLAAIGRDPDELTVRYDPVRGYPVLLQADYERNTADEEYGFSVEAFEPLP